MGSERLALAKELADATFALAKANRERHLSFADYLEKIASKTRNNLAAKAKASATRYALCHPWLPRDRSVDLRSTTSSCFNMLPHSSILR
jgi:hypothetical protein